jgi:hypothetical protein
VVQKKYSPSVFPNLPLAAIIRTKKKLGPKKFKPPININNHVTLIYT